MDQLEQLNKALEALDVTLVRTMQYQETDDEQHYDIALASISEVRAAILQIKPYAVLDDRLTEAKGRPDRPTTPDLPDIRPKKKPKKKRGRTGGNFEYRVRDVECPKCGAKPDKPCVKLAMGRGDKKGGMTRPGAPMSGGNTHAERGQLAKKRHEEKQNEPDTGRGDGAGDRQTPGVGPTPQIGDTRPGTPGVTNLGRTNYFHKDGDDNAS